MKKHSFKKLRIAGLILLLVCALLVGGFLLWANDYYHADDVALAVMNSDSWVEVIDNLTILSPDNSTDTGIIFLPGSKS